MDSDHDGKVDQRDFFENGKRIRHERISAASGLITEIIEFDGQERPLKIEKDTNGEGRFDAVYHFKEGKLAIATGQLEGKAVVTERYEKDKVVERRLDEEGDGKAERITFYDENGLLRESRHDLDKNGTMETVRTYHEGRLVEETRDQDQDGRFEWLPASRRNIPLNR